MEIKIMFLSGNVETFTTTMLTHAEDPNGFIVDATYVDFEHPDIRGIVLDRRYFSETEAEEGWIKSNECIAYPQELENAAAILVDGTVAMVRKLNEDGSGGEWVNVAAQTIRKLMYSVVDDDDLDKEDDKGDASAWSDPDPDGRTDEPADGLFE